MDTFDLIIIGLGITLIAIGLYLFVSGNRDSGKSNQVEGFGIKLNVSNPSIILIVFGIGLVVFPRIMSNGPVKEIVNDLPSFTEESEPNQQNPTLETDKINANSPADNPKLTDNASPSENSTSARTPNSTPRAPRAFFPQGTWYLSQYQENGIDLTNNIDGSIRFKQLNENSQSWYADIVAVDGWGNIMNYYYNGTINATAGAYNIDTQSSNDPTFMRQQPSRLIMKMDNPNSLHMEYMFNGSLVIMHFMQ